LAATASLDFFADANSRDRRRPVAVVARDKRDHFGWDDVPRRPQAALGQSARVAFSFARSMHPTALRIAAGDRNKVPWHVSLIFSEGVDLGDESVKGDLTAQLRLARLHLEWLSELQGGGGDTAGEVKRALFDQNACKPLDDSTKWDETRFAELLLESPRKDRSVDWVWRRLAATSSGRLKSLGAKGLGILQSALYEACA